MAGKNFRGYIWKSGSDLAPQFENNKSESIEFFHIS